MNVTEENKFNLLQYLDDFLKYKASDAIAQKERSAMSKNSYFHKIAENMTKLGQKPSEWLYEFETALPEEYLEFSMLHRQTLMTYVQFDLVDFSDFAYHMRLLCQILSYYENNNELTSPIAQTFLQTYAYMKTLLLPEFYPEKAKLFKEKLTQQENIKADRPKCPKCKTGRLVSMGLNYYCKDCRRQTMKHLVK